MPRANLHGAVLEPPPHGARSGHGAAVVAVNASVSAWMRTMDPFQAAALPWSAIRSACAACRFLELGDQILRRPAQRVVDDQQRAIGGVQILDALDPAAGQSVIERHDVAVDRESGWSAEIRQQGSVAFLHPGRAPCRHQPVVSDDSQRQEREG